MRYTMERQLAVLFYAFALLSGSSSAQAGWPTEGGERGRLIAVTTLAEDGPGSLRAALAEKGPRKIVFSVGGEIWIKDTLLIREPFVTVAGETAPAPGITIMGDRIRIRSHDVILRHLRVRVGALPGSDPGNRDGIAIDGSIDGRDPGYNVLIEHCSVSWSIDELLQSWGPGNHDIAIRSSIFAEALRKSIHPKGAHSMGPVIGPGVSNVLIDGNLFAHNDNRNPVLSGGAAAVIVNNLIYNPGFAAVHVYPHQIGTPTLASIVGNVVIAGPNTSRRLAAFSLGVNDGSKIYYRDNVARGTIAFIPDERAGRLGQNPSPIVDHPPIWFDHVTPRPASEVFEMVLSNVGARPQGRDATDQRLIDEARHGTGSIRDAPADPRLDPASPNAQRR